MTEREDTIERIERVLSLTHKDSITVTIPRLTAERVLSLLKEYQEKQEGLPPAWQDRTQEHICQRCGGIVWQEDNYCSKCGQAVKWNA